MSGLSKSANGLVFLVIGFALGFAMYGMIRDAQVTGQWGAAIGLTVSVLSVCAFLLIGVGEESK
jgi:EamA domain-containing membrane protein RarD